jgi:hypothetical protein
VVDLAAESSLGKGKLKVSFVGRASLRFRLLYTGWMIAGARKPGTDAFLPCRSAERLVQSFLFFQFSFCSRKFQCYHCIYSLFWFVFG